MHSCILAELASQHHLSDYNRLRYGPKGMPLSHFSSRRFTHNS